MRVGLVGIGNMGFAMAERLHERGWLVPDGLLAKDTALAMRAAQDVAFELNLGSLTATLFAQACEQGLRDRDDASLFEHLRGRRC